MGYLDESLFGAEFDVIPSLHVWRPTGYSLCVSGKPWIGGLRFVGVVKKRKPTPNELRHENFTWYRQTMIPICGPFYKLKNGSWYYENPVLKLYRGDTLDMYLKINFTNITKRDEMVSRCVVPIGRPPRIGTIEDIENSNEDYNNPNNFNIFNYF